MMTEATKATLAYEAQRARMERALERLREVLAAQDDEQSRDPKNWGYAGAMQHAAQTIEIDVCAFLSGLPR